MCLYLVMDGFDLQWIAELEQQRPRAIKPLDDFTDSCLITGNGDPVYDFKFLLIYLYGFFVLLYQEDTR